MSTNDPLDLDRQICFPLYAATRAVTRRYTEVLADVGLTYPQWLCGPTVRCRWVSWAGGCGSTPAP